MIHEMSMVRKSKATSPSKNNASRTPSPRVAAKRARKRDGILDVVEAICDERGDISFSMKDVAAGADFAVGALYRYFPNKEALLAATQTRAMARLEAHLLERGIAAENAAGDSAHGLQALFEVCFGYITFGAVDPSGQRLLSSMLATPKAVLADEEAAVAEASIARILGYVDELYVAAGYPGGGPLPQLLWAFLVGLGQLEKRDRLRTAATDPVTRLFVQGVSALLIGSGAARGAVEKAAQRFVNSGI